MKKKFTRIIAGLLFATMVVGSIPAGAVSAAEVEAGETQKTGQDLVGEEPSGNSPEEGNAGEVTDGTESSVGGQTDSEQENADKQQSGTETPATASDAIEERPEEGAQDKGTEAEEIEDIETGGIDFVYIESPYLETPGTQRIVFSFNQEITGVDAITLTVADESGNREEWALSRQRGNLYLFEKEYTGDAYTGTYHAVNLNLYGDEDKSIMLEEAGVTAEFGVNEAYEGIEELHPVDGTSQETDASLMEASVVTIDENGVTEAQDSIADALNTVSAQTAAANGISTYSLDDSAEARSARSGDIVVALDPGHDANDAGAQANGLKEEVLTLKIAQYCKEELEQYSGVSVYMTRTTAACPYNCTSAGSCIQQRVQAAAAAGAQIFVSLHLNAAAAASAHGAEVIIPNTSWRPELATEGEELAEAIMSELSGLGLTWRRIYAQNTTVGETYEDGSISDYFSVQIYCKENNIPGIIVEHAFLTNASDVNNFLKTEAGLKKLGVADATGIANYLGLSKGYWETDSAGNTYYYEGGQKVYGAKKIGNAWYYFDPTTGAMYHDRWREKEGQWYYYDGDGHLVVNKGYEIDDAWYFFTTSGAMLSNGWREKEGEWYYYDGNGHLVTDAEYEVEGFWYYFKSSGKMMHSEWREEGGEWYYYDEGGHLVTNIGYEVDGYWYYFKSDGTMMHSEWRDKEGKKYYYDENGHLVKNIGYEVDGHWYYFKSSGVMMQSEWRDKEGEKYYYDENGWLVKNIGLKIDGHWYYFKSSGAMMQSEWRDKEGEKYYYDENGWLVTNIGLKIDGYWYYLKSSGARMESEWRDKEGEKYYYDAEGHLVTNIGYEIDGHWYYFKSSGAMMCSEWRDKEGKKYYYDENGWLVKNTGLKIDGHWYYFKSSGAMMQSEWRDKEGKKYYYDENGWLVTSTALEIGDYWYYFKSSGAMMQSEWRDKEGKWYYYDEYGHLVVDKILTIDGVTYYFDRSGAMCDDLAEAKYAISGESSATVQDLVNYYENTSSIEFPAEALGKGGVSTLKEFCQIYYEECKTEGIKVEVAFAQAMLETGFLKFGGDVKIEQFNFAGLGAVGGGAAGASFPDVRTGIRAHVQHLKCYANSEPLKNPCVDPRWGEWLRGKAPYVSWLSIPHNPYGTGWAVDANYGIKLMQGIEKIVNN